MSEHVRIPCPHCNGTGEIPFAQEHAHLAVICRLLYACPPASAAELWEALREPVGLSAICNRMEKLLALGFVTREKHGRRYLYSLTSAGTEVVRQ